MKYGNKENTLTIFAIGFSSLILQVSLIREILISLKGNELHIGLIIFIWLVSGGAGSFTGAFLKTRGRSKFFYSTLIICGIAVSLFSFFFARHIRMFFPIKTFVPDVKECVFWTIVLVSPVSFTLDSLSGFIMSGQRGKDTAKYYFFETLGITAGGVMFTFVFSSLNSVIYGVFFSAFLLCVPLAVISFRNKRILTASMVLLAVVFIVMVTSGFIKKCDTWSRAKRYFKNETYNMQLSTSSPYGDIDVTENQGQVDIYHNGIHLGHSGIDYGNEEISAVVNLIKLKGGDLLIIGGTVSRMAQGILRWGTWDISIVEIDPEIIQARKAVSFPDVHNIIEDPVTYAAGTDNKYDVVIVRVDLPSTLILNRLYTTGYFEKVKRLLKEDGVLLSVAGRPPDYSSPSYRNILTSIYKGARKHFKYSRVLLLDSFMIGVLSDRIIPDFQEVRELFSVKITDPGWVSPYMLEMAYQGFNTQRWREILKRDEIGYNSIGKPRAVNYYLKYWVSIHSEFEAVSLPKVRTFFIASTVFLCVLVFALIVLQGGGQRRSVFLVMMVTGFVGMAYEICIVYLFQMKMGSLFSAIGLLFASFMVGSSAGSFLGRKMKRATRVHVAGVQLMIFLLCLITGLLWRYITISIMIPYILNLLMGFCVGLEFAIFSRLIAKETNLTGGILHGVDLIGGGIGGFIAGLYLIPAAGITVSYFWLAVISLIAAVPFLFGKE